VLARVDQALRLSITTADYYGGKSNLVDNLIKQGDAQTATLQKGYGDLVDADMAKESATLQARQSREQLAEQSLAISNQAPKMLLRLFAH
jgi:flagellin